MKLVVLGWGSGTCSEHARCFPKEQHWLHLCVPFSVWTSSWNVAYQVSELQLVTWVEVSQLSFDTELHAYIAAGVAILREDKSEDSSECIKSVGTVSPACLVFCRSCHQG